MNEIKNIEVKDRPNSFEWGKPSSRHKVYYNTLEDLKQRITEAVAGENLLNQLKATEGGGTNEK